MKGFVFGLETNIIEILMKELGISVFETMRILRILLEKQAEYLEQLNGKYVN